MCIIICLAITVVMDIEVVSNFLLLKYTKINILLHKYLNIDIFKSVKLVYTHRATTTLTATTMTVIIFFKWLHWQTKSIFNCSFNLHFFAFC